MAVEEMRLDRKARREMLKAHRSLRGGRMEKAVSRQMREV